MLELLGLVWNEALIRPMTNGLVLLYLLLFNNFGVSILVFTVLVRLVTLPLTVRQTRQARAMAQLQPKIQELQKRYANDRQRISKETFALYKQQGVNPLGCLGPLVIQMPIWIALYWSLIRALPASPESIVSLSGVLYSWFDGGPRRRPPGQRLPLAGPSPAGPFAPAPGAGGRLHVGHPEDDHTHIRRSQAAADQPDDALDDAAHVHVLYVPVPERAGTVLGGLQPCRHGNSIQDRRVGGLRFGKSKETAPAPAAVEPAGEEREEDADGERRSNGEDGGGGPRDRPKGLDAARDEVEVEVLARAKSGFLGFRSQDARVRATRLGVKSTQVRLAKASWTGC